MENRNQNGATIHPMQPNKFAIAFIDEMHMRHRMKQVQGTRHGLSDAGRQMGRKGGVILIDHKNHPFATDIQRFFQIFFLFEPAEWGGLFGVRRRIAFGPKNSSKLHSISHFLDSWSPAHYTQFFSSSIWRNFDLRIPSEASQHAPSDGINNF